jgi:hypothetical protein
MIEIDVFNSQSVTKVTLSVISHVHIKLFSLPLQDPLALAYALFLVSHPRPVLYGPTSFPVSCINIIELGVGLWCGLAGAIHFVTLCAP